MFVAAQDLSVIDKQGCSGKQWPRVRAERVSEEIVKNFDHCEAELSVSVLLLCVAC